MKLHWEVNYGIGKLEIWTDADSKPVYSVHSISCIDLADLARACGFRLEKLPDAVMRWEEISEKDYAAKFEPAEKVWSTAAINMGMPEEDFPTGQWPFPTQQNNADLEEHIARSPENEAAEYRVAVKKAIFRGPL